MGPTGDPTMSTLRFTTPSGSPVGTDEIESYSDVAHAVIDGTFESRFVVTVGDGGSVWCNNCRASDCLHAERTRDALADTCA